MKTVTFIFDGDKADAAAQEFFTWYIDGGLEDNVVDTLSEMISGTVEGTDCDSETLEIKLNAE